MISRRKLAEFMAENWVEHPDERPELIKQLAAYLVTNRRTNEVDLLVNDIKQQIEDRYGIVLAHVTSARPLSDQLRTHIKQMLVKETGAKSARLTESVDEGLLGGAVVETASMSIDRSIKGKLNVLRSQR